MTKVGRLIGQTRERMKLSQGALAEQARVGRSWIASVETGRVVKPAPDKLERVAGVLGLDVRELLALTDQLGAPLAAPPPTDLSALVEALHRQTDALTVLTEEAAERQRAMVIEAVRGELAPLWETVRELERALAGAQPHDAELRARR